TDVMLGGPVRSLTRALEVAQAGDRIVMADHGVPYRESVTLMGGRHNGLGSQPFVIEGNGAVLEGSALVPPKGWEHFRGDVFRFQPPRMAFAQLFLNGPPVERRYLDNTAGRLPALAARQWCLADGWIYFRVDEQSLPEDYPLTYAAQTVGITLYEVHDLILRNLTVQGFQLDGINAHDCAQECQLIGVMSRGNGRAGIAVGGASSVRIRSCLLSDNGAEQILTDGPSITSIEETEIDTASAPALRRKEGVVFVDGRRILGQTIDELPASANP
ncbi:MAG: right-handed parallel beta-helix repeat-containing protein, partial [Singulisphaera sp.]